jgi:hypothetical protein
MTAIILMGLVLVVLGLAVGWPSAARESRERAARHAGGGSAGSDQSTRAGAAASSTFTGFGGTGANQERRTNGVAHP